MKRAEKIVAAAFAEILPCKTGKHKNPDPCRECMLTYGSDDCKKYGNSRTRQAFTYEAGGVILEKVLTLNTKKRNVKRKPK